MIRARIAFRADPARRLIVVRYIGDLNGDQICCEMMDMFRDVENVWEYDCLYDLTRHTGVVSSADNEELGRQWQAIAQGRDIGRCTAIVSQDPLLHARAKLSQSSFSARTLALFYTVEEGEAWIAGRRAEENRKTA
jgi:hypothetical protein